MECCGGRVKLQLDLFVHHLTSPVRMLPVLDLVPQLLLALLSINAQSMPDSVTILERARLAELLRMAFVYSSTVGKDQFKILKTWTKLSRSHAA